MSERLDIYKEKMTKTLANMQGNLQGVRAGRANPHVLDKVMVNYYGTPTPLAQVGNISVPEARMIVISPWEKSLVGEIVKAIQVADIGINPTADGETIRLIFPELTEERRKDLTKEVKKMGEDAKVACRNIRRDGNDMLKKLKKQGDVSEDEIADDEETLQKVTDEFMKKIDVAIEEKTKELMTV